MNHNDIPAYGLWSLVVINSAIFIMFAYSFAPPKTSRDWRSFGAFSAFLVALFAEMYGYPLTIYLLSGWLTSHYPGVNWLSHDAGHLLEMMFGWKANPHMGPFHIASQVLIIGGFILTAVSWKILYAAQRTHQLAKTGPYARMRHPQYVGFILVMTGFLLQWPTIVTLLMYPILVTMYVRLSLREERDALAEFGNEYERYAANVPRFLPRFGHPRDSLGNNKRHAH
ncbi:MAG: isoprenylcysteine carboxylmethyltransferase family protein [Nevskiaceae bacterium]|nr:MAG: isoprenylcysteine carboxylmethyltransferase family protein [Nevskiaceae bacterium]